jgi:hypothetical protein
MKPQIPPQDPSNAPDALFDQIERELALLTTASLDAAHAPGISHAITWQVIATPPSVAQNVSIHNATTNGGHHERRNPHRRTLS